MLLFALFEKWITKVKDALHNNIFYAIVDRLNDLL